MKVSGWLSGSMARVRIPRHRGIASNWLNEMTKAGVEKCEKLLASTHVSMVIVRLTIPIGISPTDKLDVQVEVPPACGTKSLAGGYLLLTRLHEILISRGVHTGNDLALAYGPVMIGTLAKPNDPKVGRVLGGGRVKKDYPYTLAIKDSRKSFHTSRMLETVVNERFHQMEDGHQKGVATAKTDAFLVLKVPKLYHQNQEHFFRVVQLLPMVEGPELRERRIGAWTKELQDPKTAGIAALKLEGIGSAAIEPLKDGLKNSNSQIRYFCAESLAYLNDTSGVDTLAETVAHHSEFRAYALAALASLDQPASHLKLRKLMDEPDIEVRYGAFNALRTLDPRDPFLGHTRVLDEPKRDDDEEIVESPNAMALAITAAARRSRARQDDPFSLYVVDSEGPPLIHISRTRRSEIVIFGREQKLMTPIVLGAGAILLNASINDEKVELSKIVASRLGDADVKITSSLDLAEVVRRTANLGASYPEIVSILETANRQKNLSGELVVDAVPNPSHLYLEAILGKDTTKKDDALKRASADTKSRRWRFFSLFRRDSDMPIPNTPADSSTAKDFQSAKSGQDVVTASGSTPTSKGATADTSASGNAKKGNDGSDDGIAKKDDALQKASVTDSPPRWRLSDMFRGSGDQ